MRAVISLGGRIISDAVDAGDLDDHVAVIDDLARELDTLVVVTGAGALKRYQRVLDGVPEARKDIVGMQAARLHAATLAAALDANAAIPDTQEEVVDLAASHDVVVVGGMTPGQSTDAVAAAAAELIGADRLVLATTVDGVYEDDPREHPDTERYDELSYDELLDLIWDYESGAGTYALIDATAAKLLQRSELETVVLDGRDPDTLSRCLDDDHGGTVIRR